MSNSAMKHTHDKDDQTGTQQRLTALEIKATFTEDLLEQLDKVIFRQQQQIDALISEVVALRQPAGDTGTDSARQPRDELPPHF